MNRSTPGLPVHHQFPEFSQTHVHRVSDAIQPSPPLSSPSPPAPNPSQHQSLFQWVNSSHEVAKVLEFQLKYILGKVISNFKIFLNQNKTRSLMKENANDIWILKIKPKNSQQYSVSSTTCPSSPGAAADPAWTCEATWVGDVQQCSGWRRNHVRRAVFQCVRKFGRFSWVLAACLALGPGARVPRCLRHRWGPCAQTVIVWGGIVIGQCRMAKLK